MRTMRYIFVTGGVVSSLGKGLTAASMGALLEAWGLRVALKKFDPYLNVDPGTMNPFQHGEVYVLADGAETDLDLGHYERFTNAKLTADSSTSSGKVYAAVLKRERKGEYLGQTVQVIPHVTDEIKKRMHAADKNVDVTIIELGGTVGDIESMPFLEAIRQFVLDEKKSNVLFAHVALLPYLRVADEIKTKPAQQSVALLRGIGIQPDLLLCRTEKRITDEIRRKLSLFCNVPVEGVIQELDVQSIYEVPNMLHEEGVDRFILNYFGFAQQHCNLDPWKKVVSKIRRLRRQLTIALVGKYVHLQDAYKSVYESLDHGAIANGCRLGVLRVDPELLEKENVIALLKDCRGILVPGGFGNRGILGKLSAIRHARTMRIPFFGICLGMQLAVVEFARNVAGLEEAHSVEFAPETPHPVITLMDSQRNLSTKGGTMRLGHYDCQIVPETLLQKAYGDTHVLERHRHRYEFNGAYVDKLVKSGLTISGTGPHGLVEAVEIAEHPWFIGVQFHPEFQSNPHRAHPLFRSFIGAALEN